MSSSRKRTFDDIEDTGSSNQLCIVHLDNSNNEHFTRCSLQSFEKLEAIRDQRLAEPHGSPNRMEDICLIFPNSFSEDYGYHRDCYQRFTMALNGLRARRTEAQSSSATGSASKRRRSREPEHVIFNPDCIFCRKEGRKGLKKRGNWTSEATTRFEFGGGAAVLKAAEQKTDDDLLTRIRGVDLFACEAKFHSSCCSKYLSDSERWRSTDEGQKKQQFNNETAHKTAFQKVQLFIETEVILKKKVVKLVDLRDMYVTELAAADFANPHYRAENLKRSLTKYFGARLLFIDMGKPGKLSSNHVFSAAIYIKSAVRYSYELGNIDKFADTARSLRSEIGEAFENDEPVMWPPTAQYLESRDISIPESLQKFLIVLLTGKDLAVKSLNVNRIVSSLGQDICRAVTNGRWKLPKHILLCMALRHWFRSSELTTLLNRVGHSESYSFSLELETVIAMAVENTSTLLSPQIVRHPEVPFLFHSDFDNYDQLLNDICGMASVHTSHGIMLQDFDCSVDQETGGFLPIAASVNKTGIRSLQLETQEVLPDCYIGKGHSPPYTVEQWEVPGSDKVFECENKANMLWVIARYLSFFITKDLPGFMGFQSILGDLPRRLTTIDYYPVSNHPITDNSAVQECLRYSEEGAKEVGQAYVVTTFDLGVCMKAFPLIWSHPVKYENHIVMIGSFHAVCAYLKMVGKKMDGTGFSDILLEAGMIGSGSLNGVMNGKHYTRSTHCHKTLLEALERLLFEEFRSFIGEEHPLSTLPDEQFDLIKSLVDTPSKESLTAALQDNHISSYIDRYIQFRQATRQGVHGKTAQLWMSYMDHIWLVLQLIKAVKTNNLLLYARCLFLMCDLFCSFGGQNYARYLTFFSVFLANVEVSHPGASDLLARRAISVARSFIPENRCPVDKTIEETFMKHSKSHGGAGGSSAGLTGCSVTMSRIRGGFVLHVRGRSLLAVLWVSRICWRIERATVTTVTCVH